MTVLQKIRSHASRPITEKDRDRMKKEMEKRLRAVKKSGGLDSYVKKSVMNSVTTGILIDLNENEE